MQRAVAVVVCALSLPACLETSYVGRDARKVYPAWQAGHQGYTRGGTFHADTFGGGLQEAVAGDPQAAAVADTFHARTLGGFVATTLGAICLPVAIGYDVQQDPDVRRNVSMVNFVELGCAVAMIGGLVSLATAPPYALDAVNMFNDDVDAQPVQRWQAPKFAAPLPTTPPGY